MGHDDGALATSGPDGRIDAPRTLVRRTRHPAGRAPVPLLNENTTMQDLNETTDASDKSLILVDIDDLRAAFGGEASGADAGELAAVPTTLMCPQW